MENNDITDNLTQNTNGTANPAEAEKEREVAADLGKFKDVQALINAYNNLQAEFTRRSQRLKELEEGSNLPQPANAASEAADSRTADAQLYDKASQNAAVKDRIISDYLLTVAKNKGAPLITGGVMVATPKNKPASIKEAGRLAAEFLKKQ